MLTNQTLACAPAREALLAGAGFDNLGGALVPASQHVGVYRRRARRMEQSGHPTIGFDETVEILRRFGDTQEPRPPGRHRLGTAAIAVVGTFSFRDSARCLPTWGNFVYFTIRPQAVSRGSLREVIGP
ncbi:hypothetical protein [Streptacidiphilus rugosus]|uniref:hypothetical protein n=1 Tax=Streptacidiphilus rugosus TaxID=405783 RepID=UPI00068E3761|nr:hypothetical protein [Streptacidiphilus rugosus]